MRKLQREQGFKNYDFNTVPWRDLLSSDFAAELIAEAYEAGATGNVD